MELTKIELDNFKCFEQITIDCSKFTLLTGANSSGKSSLLMSVLGALQTKNFPFYFSPNGTYINMGDFAELAYKHDHKAQVRIGLTFETGTHVGRVRLNSAFCQEYKTKLPRLKTLHYRSNDLALDVMRDESAYRASFDYDPQKDPMREVHESPDFLAFAKSLDQFLGKAAKGKKQKGRYKKTRKQELAKWKPDFQATFFPTKSSGAYSYRSLPALFEASGNAFLKRRIREICEHSEAFDRRSNYVSSFRLSPERTYYQRTKAALKVDKFGDNWIDQIVEWEQARSPEYDDLTRICQHLGLISSIRAKRYGGGRYEIRVKAYGNTIDSSLPDVGFGVSQFLPLLVADLQLGKNSTFMTSQPEIHLHPRIQAEYVNHLVKSAKSSNKRYVIETHSEYLLNRFRLLIAKGKIKPEDVAVYYLTRSGAHVRSYRLTFEKDGTIRGAPKGFFETYMMDAMEIALHAEA